MFLFPYVNFMVGLSCLSPTSSPSQLILLGLSSTWPGIVSLLENTGDKRQGSFLLMEQEILIARLNSRPIEHTWKPKTSTG